MTDTTELQNTLALLQARYPVLATRESLPPAMWDAYAHAAVYRLEPSRIVLIDNSQDFGQRTVLRLSS